MNIRKKLSQVVSGIVAALSVLSYGGRPLEATAPAGVTFTVLNRATVPEFDATRKYRQESDDPQLDKKIWRIELNATKMVEVWTVLFTVQPGGHSGWHTHPGPAIFTVSAGTLTMYEGDDPSCTPHVFPSGTGSIEADSPAHNHLLRNESASVAQTIVTFIVPVGSPIRTDRPDPGSCSF